MLHTKVFVPALLVGVLTCGLAASAHAHVARIGGTVVAMLGATRGHDVSFDSTNRVYLVISTMGQLRGRFVSADGAPIGSAFIIQASPNYTHFPRVAFSPDADGGAGAFLVTWHESDQPQGTSVHARLVSYTRGGPFGADTQLGVGSYWEAGPAVAYATGAREFLVGWKHLGLHDLVLARVSNAGTLIGRTTIPSAEGERDPSIAYNPATNHFLVVYTGWGAIGAFAQARLVQAGTDNIGPPVVLGTSSGTYITDVSYSAATNQFLAAWYAPDASFGRLVNADGTAAGNILALSTRWKAYDALSVAFNRHSNTFFLVSHANTAEDGGVELQPNGVPVDNGFLVTAAGGSGNFYPRVTAAADRPDWLVSTSHQFTATMVQRLSGTPVSGPPPPPPPPPSDVRMALDSPAAGPVSGMLQIRGWAADVAATTGTGIDAIHVWLHPNPGSSTPATFVGAATYGASRPDVGNALGARFSNTGFDLTVAGLWPGLYDVAVYARSTVTGKWTPHAFVRVTTGSYLSVDTPLPGFNGTYFTMSGWAIDATGAAGTGVDAVHVWAHPNPGSGAPPFFVGAATYGFSRPDVAATFANPRFQNSGYQMLVFGLTPGVTYDLVAYARSTRTGTFGDARVRRVTVTTHTAIDTPVHNSTVPSSFTIDGWTIDLAAPTGTGVDAVHVWAWRIGSTAPPRFLGQAVYGLARPDVGGVFGNARFMNSGYTLAVNGLAPGTYDIGVFTRSTVRGFNAARVIRVTVP